MKRIITAAALLGLVLLLSGCGDQKSPLENVWHEDFSDTPQVVELRNTGTFRAHQIHKADNGLYYAYGPSGTYGDTEEQLIFACSGSNYSADDDVEIEAQTIAQKLKEQYPSRMERYYRVEGDILWLYDNPDKRGTPDVPLTGKFHRGTPKECSDFKGKDYFGYYSESVKNQIAQKKEQKL
ncbi:hypothetical protein [Eubacterium limosum]|uniref:hypothetical protein n=1 Tax=Eubacterium limosum TaxID=1736 RepID=UPI0037233239